MTDAELDAIEGQCGDMHAHQLIAGVRRLRADNDRLRWENGERREEVAKLADAVREYGATFLDLRSENERLKSREAQMVYALECCATDTSDIGGGHCTHKAGCPMPGSLARALLAEEPK